MPSAHGVRVLLLVLLLVLMIQVLLLLPPPLMGSGVHHRHKDRPLNAPACRMRAGHVA